jgi:hypothetical protein
MFVVKKMEKLLSFNSQQFCVVAFGQNVQTYISGTTEKFFDKKVIKKIKLSFDSPQAMKVCPQCTRKRKSF